MFVLAIFILIVCIYFGSGMILTTRGRFLVLGTDEIFISHEFTSLFDRKIKIEKIESFKVAEKPVEVLILPLKGGNKVIISSELLLENSIQNALKELESKVFKNI